MLRRAKLKHTHIEWCNGNKTLRCSSVNRNAEITFSINTAWNHSRSNQGQVSWHKPRTDATYDDPKELWLSSSATVHCWISQSNLLTGRRCSTLEHIVMYWWLAHVFRELHIKAPTPAQTQYYVPYAKPERSPCVTHVGDSTLWACINRSSDDARQS